MDGVVWRWPASSTAGQPHPELDFMSKDALERWLGSDDCLDDGAAGHNDDDHPPGSGLGQPLASAAPKARGRKPGPRIKGPVVSHVEAERQRRDKLNRRFCPPCRGWTRRPSSPTLEVRKVGQEAAALRLTTTTTTAASHAAHAPARFMLALRSLDMTVQHACVCRVGGVTAAALRDEPGLRAALVQSLQLAGPRLA